jgi:hypothetical protein
VEIRQEDTSGQEVSQDREEKLGAGRKGNINRGNLENQGMGMEWENTSPQASSAEMGIGQEYTSTQESTQEYTSTPESQEEIPSS